MAVEAKLTPAQKKRQAANRDRAKAKRVERIPQRVLVPPKPIGGFRDSTLKGLRLDGEDFDVGLRDAHTDITTELTIQGASTVTIPVFDPERVLGTVGILDTDRNGLLDEGLVLEMDNLEFVLVRVEKASPTYTLIFESLTVNLLRRFTERKKAYRDQVTRAEFMWSLIKEAEKATNRKIGFFSPELRDRQPIGRPDATVEPSSSRTSRERDTDRKAGFSPGARITVKGAAASKQQRDVIAGCLAQAEGDGASPEVQAAVVACIIQESNAGQLAGVMTGNDDVGIFQQGRNWISEAGSKQPGPSTHAFLVTGPSSWKKVHGSLKNVPGGYEAAIKKVQISIGGYQAWVAEAQRAVTAFNGGTFAGLTSSGRSTSRQVNRRYAFSRGQKGKPESTWTCGTRLAEEVGWEWFEFGGGLVFASDEELIRQRPAMTVWDGANGIEDISWTVDAGRPADEATVTCRQKLWGAQPGQVVDLLDESVATGRWLVESVSGSRYSTECEVGLVRPAAKKPEPAPETRTTTTRSPSLPGGGGAGGPVRQRIVELALASMTGPPGNTGHNYYSWDPPSNLTIIRPTSGRSDCSQWIAAIYHHAGAPSPGTYTGDMMGRSRRTDNPKPGDIIVGTDHCELYVGGGKIVGHGTDPIDYGDIGYCKGTGMYWATYDFLD